MTDNITNSRVNLFKNFSSDVIILIIGQILIAAIALFTSALIARQLGLEDRGYLVMAMLLPNILIAFSDFGMGVAGTKFTASKKWKSSIVFASNIIFVLFRLTFISILGLFLIFFFSTALFPGIPNKYLYLGLLQILGLAIQGMLLPIFLGINKTKHYSLVLLVNSLIGVLFLIIAWQTTGLGIENIILLQASSSLLVSFYIIWKLKQFIKERLVPSLKYLKEAFGFGSGIYISYVSIFTSEKIVIIILNFFGGVIYVSLHTIAQSLTERLYMITDAVGTILFPRVAEGNDNSIVLTPFIFKTTILIITAISISISFLAEWLIILIYTSEFSGAIVILRLLLVSIIFSSGWNIISNDLNARGFSKEIGYINVLLAVITLCFATLLTYQYGVIGLAIASIISYIIVLIIGLVFYIDKEEQINIFNLFLFSQSEKTFIKNSLLKFFKK